VVAVVAYWNAWSKGLGQYSTGPGGDIAQSTWFLSWPPYALAHGLNPLFSSFGNYPYGVNLIVNTSSVAVGLLVAPVTLLFGPVASFNVAMTAAMALSAIAAFALARRFTSWVPAAFAAGLLYGFSPYMAAEGVGHVMTLFVPLPPLILLLVHDIFVRQPARPLLRGVILGLLVVVQFFISIEVLAGVTIFAIVGVALGMVMGRRSVSTRLHVAAIALGSATAVCVVLLAYPIWLFLAGPGHINGQLHLDDQIYSADLLGPIVPGVLQRISPPSLVAISKGFGGNLSENGSYLGVPLLVVLVAGVIWLRRFAFIRVSGILCGLAFVLSLGSQLRVANHVYAIPLPDTLIERIPLLNNSIPVRFSLYVVLFASIILAAVLDQLHAVLRRRSQAIAIVLPGLLAVAVFIPLIPSWPYAMKPSAAPSFFTSSAVDTIPSGSAIVIYPFPDSEESVPQLWQASASFRFKLVGGRFKVAVPGRGTAVGALASETNTVLSALEDGEPPPRSPVVQNQVRSELREWQVHDVVAVPPAANVALAIPYLTWLLGARPTRDAGAWVWYRWQG
jgi:hypothetical protein